MFLALVIVNFIVVFSCLCKFAKPKLTHFLIGIPIAAPYLFNFWYFILNRYPDFIEPISAVVSLIFSIAMIILYEDMKEKEKDFQAPFFVLFLFFFWAPLLIWLPYLTK
jgi:hypothetical protein